MKIGMLPAILALVFSGAAKADANAFLAQQGFTGKTPEQIVNTIDQTAQPRPLPYGASVTATTLTLVQGEQKYHYALGDKFYLSFAPYVQQTHPCFNHSLSGCRGELPGTDFAVKITDKAGTVIVQKTITSYHNGFVGVWLPRNIEGTLEVAYQGRVATSPFSTYNDSQTCMTTLQLNAV